MGEAERLTAELGQFTAELAAAQSEESGVQRQLKAHLPRLFFAPKLPACVLLSVVGQLRKRAAERAACVKREWRGSVEGACTSSCSPSWLDSRLQQSAL